MKTQSKPRHENPPPEPRHALTEAQVVDARRRARAGESIASLARSAGCLHNTMYAAVRGRSWKGDLAEPPVLPDEDIAPAPDLARESRPLTREDVVALRRAVRAGSALGPLCEEAGVSYAAAYQAVRGLSWKSVTEEPPVAGLGTNAGKTLKRKKSGNVKAPPELIDAMRREVSSGARPVRAWETSGLRAAGCAYATALEVMRSGPRERGGVTEPPVTRPLRRGTPPALPEEAVRDARLLAARTGSHSEVTDWARGRGLSPREVLRAVRGRSWSWLQDPPPVALYAPRPQRPPGRISDRPNKLPLPEAARLRLRVAEGHTLTCAAASIGQLPGATGKLPSRFAKAVLGQGWWARLTDPPPLTVIPQAGVLGCCSRSDVGMRTWARRKSGPPPVQEDPAP